MKKYGYVEQLISNYPKLGDAAEDIKKTCDMLENCYKSGGKILIAGNGGSAADSEHIVGELMKGFVKSRRIPQEFADSLKSVDAENGSILCKCLQQGIPAIALSGHPALSTAYLNDVEGTVGFAQQVYGYGKPEDIFLAISTSGNSKNVLYAAITAKAMGITVIGLTGGTGGQLVKYSDILIKVPETEPYKVQEYHLPVYHAICLELEERLFSE
ncbi:MAG: SIS domain-containing protein [Lachnospiraceae bacterium]|nr:SIS domain-containing protein [Lachnospiraceae bacterium]